MLLGLLGVAMFSLTIPFTRMAVAELDPVFVALGRALGAALLAAAWLAWKRAPLPPHSALLPLALVAGGCIVGFPLLTSIALRTMPSAHGALLVGVLPLATALYAALRGFERPSRGFWAMALLGASLVAAFALSQDGGSLRARRPAGIRRCGGRGRWLCGGRAPGAQPGRAGNDLLGPAPVRARLLPVLLCMACRRWPAPAPGPGSASATSPPFRCSSASFSVPRPGLGGVARVGQVQLLQPFLSLAGAALLLGESLTLKNCAFALAVAAVVFGGRRMGVRRR